jgi:hypothetical protein
MTDRRHRSADVVRRSATVLVEALVLLDFASIHVNNCTFNKGTQCA